MDDKELENSNNQQSDAGQKTAHVAGKAAATYYGGNVGGQLYNAASSTKVGQEIEKAVGKNVQNTPLLNQASQKLNDSGALDAADKGLDLANGAGIGGTDNKDGDKSGESNPLDGINPFSNNSKDNKSSFSNDDSTTDSDIDSPFQNPLDPIIKKYKFQLLGYGASAFLLIASIILVIAIVYSVGDAIADFFEGIVDFFTKDQKELQEEYYQTLKDVQTDINEDYGICIDINLITAALTVNMEFEDFIEDNQDPVDDVVDDSEDGAVNYKEMTKHVRLLANMQIMNQKYSLDKTHKEETEYYCKTSSEEIPVDASNQSRFDISFFEWLNGETDLDSSTYEKIADNDKGGLGAFFSKKSNEEKNYAYYLYYPSFDEEGKCDSDYAKNMIPADKPILSIGDLKTKEDSVFYWNLINSFIPEYYEEYLPEDESAKIKRIHEIADDIYLLYNDMGPSMNCPSYNTAYNCGSLDIINTSLTKEEFVAGINNYSSNNELWYLIKDNAEQIYDVSVHNELNPEIVVTRAILEGFAPGNRCGSMNYNIWGWGASNGKECENGKVWNTWDEALLGFITGFKNSFPTTEDFLKKYAYLGDYWYNPGNAGLGGCYYAPHIYSDGMPEHVKNACDTSKSNTCTLDNTANCVKTTEQDKLAYGQYQAKNTNDLRKKIWNLASDSCGSYGIQEGKCVIFYQNNPEWGNIPLINGTTTLGRAGCAVTSVSIAMTCSGTLKNPASFSPKVLNEQLRLNQSPSYGGNIVWGNPAIGNLTNGFHYSNTVDLSGSVDYRINKLNELIKPNRALIIHTSSRAISPNAGSHFVVLSSIEGSSVRILDPGSGKIGRWSVMDIDKIVIYEW